MNDPTKVQNKTGRKWGTRWRGAPGPRDAIFSYGVASLIAYIVIGSLVFFMPGVDRSYFPPYLALPVSGVDVSGLYLFGAVLGLSASILFVLYLLALRRVPLPGRLDRPAAPADGDARRRMFCILGFTAAFHLVILFYPTLISTDLFDYVRHGRIFAVYGENPLTVPAIYFQHDPFFNMGGWVSTGSVYGPLHVYISGGLALIAGESVGGAFILFKAFYIALNLVNVLLVWKIAARLAPGSRNKALLFYGWNPFILIMVASSGHNDILMLALVLSGILCYLDRRFLLGALCLTLATLVKFVTLPLLVLYVALVIRKQEDLRMRLLYGGASAAVAVATTVISYLPFWDGWDTFGYLSQVGNKTGFTIASLLGGYLNGNLGLPRGGAIFILALPLAAYLAWKAWRVRELEDFVSGAAVIAFFVPLMMFWFQPWYLVLALGLLALRPRGPLYIAAIVFSMSVIFYDSFWWQAPIRMDVQKVLRVLIVFGPPLALLLVLKARHLIPDAWRRTVAWSLQEPGAGEGGEGAARLSAARMTLEMAALVSAAAVPIAVTVSSSPQLRSFVDLVIFKLRLLYPF